MQKKCLMEDEEYALMHGIYKDLFPNCVVPKNKLEVLQVISIGVGDLYDTVRELKDKL